MWRTLIGCPPANGAGPIRKMLLPSEGLPLTVTSKTIATPYLPKDILSSPHEVLVIIAVCYIDTLRDDEDQSRLKYD